MELELLLLWVVYILIEMHGLSHSPSCTERVVACVEKKTQGLVAGTSLPRSHKLQDGDACSGIQIRPLYMLCLFGLSALLELEMENFSSIRPCGCARSPNSCVLESVPRKWPALPTMREYNIWFKGRFLFWMPEPVMSVSVVLIKIYIYYSRQQCCRLFPSPSIHFFLFLLRYLRPHHWHQSILINEC